MNRRMHDVPFHVWIDKEQRIKLQKLLNRNRFSMGENDAEAFRHFIETAYYREFVSEKRKLEKAPSP
jgi:hypothetical protein